MSAQVLVDGQAAQAATQPDVKQQAAVQTDVKQQDLQTMVGCRIATGQFKLKATSSPWSCSTSAGSSGPEQEEEANFRAEDSSCNGSSNTGLALTEAASDVSTACTEPRATSCGSPLSAKAQEREAEFLLRYLELSGMPALDHDSWNLCLRTVRLLCSCEYSLEEVCSVLAHASSYFRDIHITCGNRMSPNEAGNIMVALVFIAHSYVLDEACPLSVWHRHLCRRYCTLKVLDAAVLRLMKMRGYILRLDDKELQQRFDVLHFAATGGHP